MFDRLVISEVQPVKIPDLPTGTPKIHVLREDLLHPHISGNKWRKLRYNFLEMRQSGMTKLVTFGGAFSNHIAATAACAKAHNYESIGIIRGDELNHTSNHTLRFASEQGMKLIFVSREAYRGKEEPDFLNEYMVNPKDYYLIPEGGTNKKAIKGTSEILGSHTENFDVICVCAGTGGTAAGIINSAMPHQKVLVFPALKGDFLKKEIGKHISVHKKYGESWELIGSYHFGGYAKWNMQLVDFINKFKEVNQIAIDIIYNGKMIFGLQDLIKNSYFYDSTRILAIHTGGTQSTVGFNEINGLLIK
ncbi:MAG: pyridoxal-phosphate dependent enzyme [Bacteroidota bacterium]